MLRNYLRSILRNFQRSKSFAVINILGLTAGFTACLLIALFVEHEASFDKFQPNGQRIARVIMEYAFDGSPETNRGNFTSTKVGPTLVRTFPEVENAVRMSERETTVSYSDKMFTEPNFMFADSSFITMFYVHWLSGNPKHALDRPNDVVLTRSSAVKYFNKTDVIGETLLVGTDKTPYLITGVIDDYPSNSQIRLDFLASFSSLHEDQQESYFEADYTTYLLLRDENSFVPLQAKLFPFMEKEMSGSGASIKYYLEHFNEIHLHSPYAAFVPNGSATYLYILSAIGLLALVIVSVTYVNLSTARSIDRAREVGVRKVVGAGKPQLFWQFIGESWLSCLIALFASYASAIALLPYFNRLTGTLIPLNSFFSPLFTGASICGVVILGLLAGTYPAVVLTGFQPVRVLKGDFRSGGGRWIQRGLLSFQFVISIVLIGSTVIIQKQLYYIQHKDLGYNRSHILIMHIDQEMHMIRDIRQIKEVFKSNPDVLHVSYCVGAPNDIYSGYNMRTPFMPEDAQMSVTGTPIDEEYIRTTGLQIVAGTDLTEQDMKDVMDTAADKRIYHFVLNQSAAAVLGWTPEEAIGQPLIMGYRKGTVKAVVKDFNFQSMHVPIKPVVLFTENRGRKLLVKVKGNHLQQTIAFLQAKWKQVIPYKPFDYTFLDESYDEMYHNELKLGEVMRLFSGIAILLACSGLFGLSSYLIQRRSKEISIRKILGAPLSRLWSTLSGGFLRLVFLSALIAVPIVYILMRAWLQGFAYHVNLSWTALAFSGLATVAVALLTISLHVYRAASTNPVEMLRE